MSAFRSLAVVLATLLPAVAFAQGPGPRRPPREDAFRMVDAYIVANLQESVDLTDEQFVKVLPLVKRFQRDRRELLERRRQALRELQRMLQSGTATEARVADRLREVKGLETEEVEKIRANLEAIDALLTPLQQAKFRIMQLEVEHKIREILQEVRQRRRGGPDEP